jgi:hypothetical protein
MLRTVQVACTLPKVKADALNAESGRIYTDMLVQHYRRYRKQGVWLSQQCGERMEDADGAGQRPCTPIAGTRHNRASIKPAR